MSDAKADKGLLVGLLLAGAAAVGIWKLLGGARTRSPEEEHAAALRDLERLPHPLSADYPEAAQRALNRLSAAKARLDLQRMRDAGYDTGDPEMDEAYLEMHRYKYDPSPSKFLQATQKYLD